MHSRVYSNLEGIQIIEIPETAVPPLSSECFISADIYGSATHQRDPGDQNRRAPEFVY